MYQVRSNGNGYSFETSNGSVYEVYFTKLDNLSDYFQKEIGTNDVYYFGIERITENKGGNDIFIKRTIAYIIITFFDGVITTGSNSGTIDILFASGVSGQTSQISSQGTYFELVKY